MAFSENTSIRTGSFFATIKAEMTSSIFRKAGLLSFALGTLAAPKAQWNRTDLISIQCSGDRH